MQVSTRLSGSTTIIDVTGDIDLANSPQARKAVLGAIRDSSVKRVIVNLKAVRYIDSSGVASLVEALKISRDLGKRLGLVGLSTAAREVLELSRLITIFEVHETEQQALEA